MTWALHVIPCYIDFRLRGFQATPSKDNVTCANLTASVKFSSTRVQFDRGELIQYFNSKSIFQAALFDWFIRRLVPFQRRMPTDSPIRRGLPRFAPIFASARRRPFDNLPWRSNTCQQAARCEEYVDTHCASVRGPGPLILPQNNFSPSSTCQERLFRRPRLLTQCQMSPITLQGRIADCPALSQASACVYRHPCGWAKVLQYLYTLYWASWLLVDRPRLAPVQYVCAGDAIR